MKHSARTNQLLALIATAVLVGSGVAATTWLLRDDGHAAAEDCAVVAELVDHWSTAEADEAAPGIGDQAAAMSDRTRAAANRVTNPELQRSLNSWADGFALLDDIRRDTQGRSITAQWSAEDLQGIDRADELIYGTAEDVAQQCPEVFAAGE